MLAGLAFLIAMVPLNGFVAQRSRVFQMKLMGHKDVRLRHFNEILSGIKVGHAASLQPDPISDQGRSGCVTSTRSYQALR